MPDAEHGQRVASLRPPRWPVRPEALLADSGSLSGYHCGSLPAALVSHILGIPGLGVTVTVTVGRARATGLGRRSRCVTV